MEYYHLSVEEPSRFFKKKNFYFIVFFPSLPFFHPPFPILLPSSLGIHSNIFNIVLAIHLTDPYLDIWAPLQKYTRLLYVGV